MAVVYIVGIFFRPSEFLKLFFVVFHAVAVLKLTSKVLPERAVIFSPSYLVVGKRAKILLKLQHAVGGERTLLPAWFSFRQGLLLSKSIAAEHAEVALVACLTPLTPAMLAIGYYKPVRSVFEADAAGRHVKTTEKM